MILSLFITNFSRNIYIQKHCKSIINPSICDYVFDRDINTRRQDDVQPIIETPHHLLVYIDREGLFYIAACNYEVPTLFVIEFLNQLVDVLIGYFNNASEAAIKSNTVLVYEILEEMLDNGFPLVMEPNILQELVKPPNMLRAIVGAVTGNSAGSVGSLVPSRQLSKVPWRRAGIRYDQNEAYFDVVEEINVCVDRLGSIVHSEIIGHIDCVMKLSGMPDLTMRFEDPSIIEDASFHPCVRYSSWEKDRVLSFIPPDGRFRLMRYQATAPSESKLPLSVRGEVLFQELSSKLNVVVSSKRLVGKSIEKTQVHVLMPQNVINVSSNPSVGKSHYDNIIKQYVWKIGALEYQQVATLNGTISVSANEPVPSCRPIIELQCFIKDFSVSGLKVKRLDLFGETFRLFKGIKYISKAGKYQTYT